MTGTQSVSHCKIRWISNALSLVMFLLCIISLFRNVNSIQRPPMLGSASILLSDDRILSFGGYYSEKQFRNEFFNDLWIFHMSNSSWEWISQEDKDIPTPRAFHSFNRISDTHALMYGGTDTVSLVHGSQGFAGSCQLNDVWKLDLQTFKWTPIQKNHKVSFQGYDYEICSLIEFDKFINVDGIVSYVFLFGLTFFSVVSIVLIRLLTR